MKACGKKEKKKLEKRDIKSRFCVVKMLRYSYTHTHIKSLRPEVKKRTTTRSNFNENNNVP